MSKRIIYNLDSCTIIEILRSNPTVVNNMLKAVGTKNKIAICSVVYYEVMRGFDQHKPPPRRRIKFDQLYSVTEHFILDDKAAEQLTRSNVAENFTLIPRFDFSSERLRKS